MPLVYNHNYLIGNQLWQLRPRQVAINTYRTSDGIIIGMFQGSRGEFPLIDFVVKILKPGIDERPFPPIHTIWVVDLLLKIPNHKSAVNEILDYYIEFYNNVTPFDTPNSRIGYTLQTVVYKGKLH